MIVIRYAGTLPPAGIRRYVFALGVWLLLWGVVAYALGSWANTASLPDASPAQRARARGGFILLGIATYAVLLSLLARVRASAE